MNNDPKVNQAVADKLRAMHARAQQQPISYKMLFEEAADLAEEQFKRAMAAESKLHRMCG